MGSIFKNKGNRNLSTDPYVLRNVHKRNGSNAFFAKQGDTFEKIADEFSIKVSKIYKYNDVDPGQSLEEGVVIYLQRKRGKAPVGNNVHTMKAGESLWSVAQWYGVRLSALCRKNRITRSEVLVPGQQISLRYRVAR